MLTCVFPLLDAIPKGVKIGDRVIWYNGATRTPIPGFVKKLYKDGTDKYTAVVKFVSFSLTHTYISTQIVIIWGFEHFA